MINCDKLVVRYAPAVYVNNKHMMALYRTMRDEMCRMLKSILQYFNNCFLMDCDGEAIREYEKLIGNMYIASNDLDIRKEVVRNTIMFHPPYTIRYVNKLLTGLYGEDATIDYAFGNDAGASFTIVSGLTGKNSAIEKKFNATVRVILPANITLNPYERYTYIYLEGLGYNDEGEMVSGGYNPNKTYEKMEEMYNYEELSKYAE